MAVPDARRIIHPANMNPRTSQFGLFADSHDIMTHLPARRASDENGIYRIPRNLVCRQAILAYECGTSANRPQSWQDGFRQLPRAKMISNNVRRCGEKRGPLCNGHEFGNKRQILFEIERNLAGVASIIDCIRSHGLCGT